MNWRREWKSLLATIGLFLAAYHFPAASVIPAGPLREGFALLRSYAREHVIACLLPALFIAGAISVFFSKRAILRHLGPGANPFVSYGIASIAGGILAVCSCTILPLFAGIYNMGAGLGPAVTFLYAGPAINVLAVTLSMRVLGLELGLARTAGAIIFGVVAGLVMQFLFRSGKTGDSSMAPEDLAANPPRMVLLLASLLAILVFANWGKSSDIDGFQNLIYSVKWALTVGAALTLILMLVAWHDVPLWQGFLAMIPPAVVTVICPACPQAAIGVGVVCFAALLTAQGGELDRWLDDSWSLAKLILPMLAIGVFISGILFGTPGGHGLVPDRVVASWIGGDSVLSIGFASIAGIFMYFATLTEVPITQGLIAAGMGPGAALALLLAGPALSLPSLLVLRGVMGFKRTFAFATIVALLAAAAGIIYSQII